MGLNRKTKVVLIFVVAQDTQITRNTSPKVPTGSVPYVIRDTYQSINIALFGLLRRCLRRLELYLIFFYDRRTVPEDYIVYSRKPSINQYAFCFRTHDRSWPWPYHSIKRCAFITTPCLPPSIHPSRPSTKSINPLT